MFHDKCNDLDAIVAEKHLVLPGARVSRKNPRDTFVPNSQSQVITQSFMYLAINDLALTVCKSQSKNTEHYLRHASVSSMTLLHM